jgi:hypothetical protein
VGLFDARFNCLQPIHNQLPRISPLRQILTTHFLLSHVPNLLWIVAFFSCCICFRSVERRR